MGDELFLAGIYLSPEWQNQGLGAVIIGDVLASAKARGQRVSLQVLKVNPARRLYERLGFSIFAETDTHFKMRHFKMRRFRMRRFRMRRFRMRRSRMRV
ncbi:MAG: GNAT family N-acetyltransferase [Candidatus Promineifilaceae bacterium]